MEKKKWLWKRRSSSERSPGESETSGSFSSNSERYSDEHDASRESPKGNTHSPEIMSKASVVAAAADDEEMHEAVKSLTGKLSSALVNLSAKEDLIKQHAKVAEEAVSGWEKAENEAASLKQQLETALQQNLNMEVRVNHLDGALKECVRQLRQAKDEQEKRIADAVEEKGQEWESAKAELEKRIVELQARADAESPALIDPKCLLVLESLEKENLILRKEIMSRCKELEVMKTEKDLSIQAAETASKLQLESIKKVAKLEAECRRLQSAARKSSPVSSNSKSAAAGFYAESLTDSYSDSGERLPAGEMNASEPSCSDSWASALITELDRFKNDKPMTKGLATCSVEIDMMDDFLEMERLAALPDTKSNTPFTASESASGESDNTLKAELDLMNHRVAELEKKLEETEAEKAEVERALDERQYSLEAAQSRIAQVEARLNELQKGLNAANDAKELLESQLVGMEAEARTMSANIDSLKADIMKERTLSTELQVRCRELDNELKRKVQETEIQQNTDSNGLKIKQEELAVAADKLAECQRTIASLGKQLKSLATLEDFLIDTSNIPGFSKGLLVSGTLGEICKPPSTDTSSDSDTSGASRDNLSHLENGNGEASPALLSSSTPSTTHVNAGKSRNGFGKFFSRSKTLVELNHHQE